MNEGMTVQGYEMTEGNDGGRLVQAAKKICGGIGVRITLMLLIAIGAQLVWGIVMGAIGAGNTSQLMWLATFVPMYVIAIPIGILMLRGVRSEQAQVSAFESFSFGRLVKLFVICFAVMYIGNIIGTSLMTIVTGGTVQNEIIDYAMDSESEVLKVLFVVLLGPLMEEIVFRKLIIDRTRGFGEKYAILFSALMFALFHMNPFQFFYAFGIGLIFGYIYLKSGKIRYTYVMHAIFNFFGAVVSGLLLRGIKYDELQKVAETSDPEQLMVFMQQDGVLAGLMIFMVYALVLFALVITGIVLLILSRKKFTVAPPPAQADRTALRRGMFLNAGIIVFYVVTTALTVWLRFM